MTQEQQKTLDGLNIAIQMEIDGKEFYSKAAAASANELGKKLLNTLAGEEDIHRKVFIGIYESIKSKRGWPAVDFHPDGGRGLRTVFSETLAKSGTSIKVGNSEVDAVLTARNMETKTFDFYRRQMAAATEKAEEDFYERLASQEQEHNLILADYYEYLKNPAGWFVKKEHPSLD